MSVFPTYMSVHHMHTWCPQGKKSLIDTKKPLLGERLIEIELVQPGHTHNPSMQEAKAVSMSETSLSFIANLR